MAISASVTRGFTYATGVEITAANLNELGEPPVTVATPIAIASGGTNATSAGAARTNLGVQASDAGLADIAALATTNGNFIVGDGGNWVAESGSTARTSLGVGTISTQASNAVALTGGTISGTIMTLPSYAVSGVPSASPAGQLIYVTDGNSGAATVACSDGSNWKVVALGATIST